jgi:hypothetical protein
MIPCSIVVLNNLASTSMARINSIGDSESPWRMPLLCLMGGPGLPFNSILEEAVDKREATRLRQVLLNPSALNVSRRNG